MTHKDRTPHTVYGSTRLLAVQNPDKTDKARQDFYNQVDKCKRILFVYAQLVSTAERKIERGHALALVKNTISLLDSAEYNLDSRTGRLIRRLEVEQGHRDRHRLLSHQRREPKGRLSCLLYLPRQLSLSRPYACPRVWCPRLWCPSLCSPSQRCPSL